MTPFRFVLTMVVMTVPWTGPSWAAAQTLTNPSFETHAVDPVGWVEYGDGAVDADARVYTVPTYALSTALDGTRVYGAVKNGSRMGGGIYQHVFGATPGTVYRAQVWIRTTRTGDGEMRSRIGIDPCGGLDPSSGNVVWTLRVHSDNQWTQIHIDAQAVGPELTIFLAYSQSGSTGFAINYFDLAELIANPPPSPPCTDATRNASLSDRRVDVSGYVEAQYTVPPGYVITGIGARGSAGNVSTMAVRQALLLGDGSLGEPEIVRFGWEPDGPLEATILLPPCYVAVGYGARAAGEFDIFTLMVKARPILIDGSLGGVEEFRAGFDAYNPGLEREFLAESGRVLTGVGLRMEYSDITGIYAETDLHTTTPAALQIQCDPLSLSRRIIVGTNPTNDSFTVGKTGTGTLVYAITDNMSWLVVSPESGISEGEIDTIQVIYGTASLPVGSYSGVITISAPLATNSPQTIAVSLQVDPIPGDFDIDGDVDQEDFGHFQGCLTGMGIVPQAGCADADIQTDSDVDSNDFAIFQRCLSGANVPANPYCAGP